jgi:hypothetical protein
MSTTITSEPDPTLDELKIRLKPRTRTALERADVRTFSEFRRVVRDHSLPAIVGDCGMDDIEDALVVALAAVKAANDGGDA